MDISLYRMIPTDDRESVFVNSVPLMNIISHEIEDVVTENRLPVNFYAGFQRYSNFTRQIKRYTRLAQACRRVYVWGLPDVTPPHIPGVEYLPLTEDTALAREWFVVVDSPQFFTALLTQESTYGMDIDKPDRRFTGIWTYDSDLVSRAHLLISQVLGQFYEGVQRRDYETQSKYLVQISNRLVQRQNDRDGKQVLDQHHGSLLRAGLNHIEVPLLVLDGQQRVISVSHAAEALLRTSTEAMINTPLTEVCDGLFVSLALGDDGTPTTATPTLHGAPITVSATAVLDVISQPIGWVVTLRQEIEAGGGAAQPPTGSTSFPTAPVVQRYLSGLQQLLTMLPSLAGRPEVQQRVVSQMQRLVNEANTLVRRLALLQELQTRTKSAREQVHLSEVAQAELDTWSAENPQLTAQFVSDPPGTAGAVQANAEHLQLAVRELLDNVSQRAQSPAVQVVLREQDGMVLLSVADKGLGIDPGDLAQIFDTARRAQAAANSSTPVRIGLGVALAQAVAHAYGGKLDAQSTLGKGSTFTLTLPAA